jgi:uncharacterized protein with PQ loop repeat
MRRAEFAAKIHWEKIIFIFGILNALAVTPQLWQLWETRITEGLSVEMLFIYLSVQLAFTLHGYFIRDRALLYCIGLSAIINTATIASALYLRSLGL